MMQSYAGYLVEMTLIRTELTLRLFVMHAVEKMNLDFKKMIREAVWNWITKSSVKLPKREQFASNRSQSAPENIESWRVKEDEPLFKPESIIKTKSSSTSPKYNVRFDTGQEVIQAKHNSLKRSLSDSRIG